MAKVAFLGLGVMGYPMAGHLKNKGGHEVTVYNRTAAKAEKWVGTISAAQRAATPKAAAAGQDFVMCCVGNDNDLREVTLGPNGAFAWRERRARCSSTTPPPRPRSRASFTPRPRSAASISSMRRSPAARPAPRTAS